MCGLGVSAKHSGLACAAACDINTPMRAIVNLRCVARRGQFCVGSFLSARVLCCVVLRGKVVHWFVGETDSVL